MMNGGDLYELAKLRPESDCQDGEYGLAMWKLTEGERLGY